MLKEMKESRGREWELFWEAAEIPERTQLQNLP